MDNKQEILCEVITEYKEKMLVFIKEEQVKQIKDKVLSENVEDPSSDDGIWSIGSEDKFLNESNKPIPSTSSSDESVNVLKRSLPNESVDSHEVKKIKQIKIGIDKLHEVNNNDDIVVIDSDSDSEHDNTELINDKILNKTIDSHKMKKNIDDIVIIDLDNDSNSPHTIHELIRDKMINTMKIKTKPSIKESHENIILVDSDSDDSANSKVLNKLDFSYGVEKSKLTMNSIKELYVIKSNGDELIGSNSNDDIELIYKKIFDGILEQSTIKINEEFPYLLKLFSSENLTSNHFSIIFGKLVTEILTTCKKHIYIQLMMTKGKNYKSKYDEPYKKIMNYTSEVNLHKGDSKLSVQASSLEKEGLTKMTKHLQQSNVERVCKTYNGGNIIPLDAIEYSKPSTSNSIKFNHREMIRSPKITRHLQQCNVKPVDITHNDNNVNPFDKIVYSKSSTSSSMGNNPKKTIVSKYVKPFSHLTSLTPIITIPVTTISNLNTMSENGTNIVKPVIRKNGKLLFVKLDRKNLKPGSFVCVNKLSASQLTKPLPLMPSGIPTVLKHPAQLPRTPNQKSLKTWESLPLAPIVTAARILDPLGLELSWNIPMTKTNNIMGYQIYAYNENPSELPKTELWKQIAEIDSLPLPMSSTLVEHRSGQIYHFAVRAVDIYSRVGPFSMPCTITS